MNETNSTTKIVDYYQYCPKCRYYKVKEGDEDWHICNECLSEPANEESHKPVNWKEK